MNLLIEYRFLIFFICFILNLVSFAAYGIDKYKAKHNNWRIPESTLIMFAAIGGSVGALLGMKIFHHKTRHPKFYIGVPVILIIQIVLIILLYVKCGK